MPMNSGKMPQRNLIQTFWQI